MSELESKREFFRRKYQEELGISDTFELVTVQHEAVTNIFYNQKRTYVAEEQYCNGAKWRITKLYKEVYDYIGAYPIFGMHMINGKKVNEFTVHELEEFSAYGVRYSPSNRIVRLRIPIDYCVAMYIYDWTDRMSYEQDNIINKASSLSFDRIINYEFEGAETIQVIFPKIEPEWVVDIAVASSAEQIYKAMFEYRNTV
jgi:gamma-glutamylcyclotransferase (GGCT)/AIG2-like uncharacterized protein YtfP